MVISDVESGEICKVTAQLKADITELEIRLHQDHIARNQGSLKSIAIRLLVSAERIEDLVSTLEAKEKLRRGKRAS